jgi:hypothetical protein
MASYTTSTQKVLTLPASRYIACPSNTGVPGNDIVYPEDSITIGPTPTTATYEPKILTKSRIDPSKGRRFRALSKDGAILMSPLTVKSETIENSLIHTRRYESLWRWEGINSSNTKGCKNLKLIRALDINSYERSYDLVRLMNLFPSIKTHSVSDIDFGRVTDLVTSTQTAVMADALSGYDLLTELAESRETIGSISGKVRGFADVVSQLAREDENAWRRGRRMNAKTLMRSSDKALRNLGSRWMEYRYAIMPLFYTLKDVNELVNDNGARYKTSRKRETVDASNTGVDLPTSGFYLERHVTGSIIVASTTKGRYDTDGLRSLYARRISTNPFSTAWELVPLSFVVDWFLNIGEVITAATSVDFSNQRQSCTAVREAYEESLYFVQADSAVTTLPGRTWNGIVVPPLEFDIDTLQRSLIQKRVVNNYTRTLFTRPPIRIQFQPYLNWKRFIDATVLSQQPIRKLLRSLK